MKGKLAGLGAINGFFFAVCAAFLLTATVGAETRVSGIIKKDTDWRSDQGPYLVVGDIWVKTSAVLRIEPGTVIRVASRERRMKRDTANVIPQLDHSDSQMVSIKIEGGIVCRGEREEPIRFLPIDTLGKSPIMWYGIVLDGVSEDYTEFSYVEVSGAVYGLRIRKCDPEVNNMLFAHNNTGVFCDAKSNPFLRNNTIVRNVITGILIRESNPRVSCNIIAFNRNHAVWSDGISQIDISHNCIFGSADGDLLDCPFELGVIARVNANGDSCDDWYNIYRDPIFKGSVADSIAVERDLKIATDPSRVRDTSLVKKASKDLLDNQAAQARHQEYPKYFLSPYSPCIDAGRPGKQYADIDGSKNDMGLYGGPGGKLE